MEALGSLDTDDQHAAALGSGAPKSHAALFPRRPHRLKCSETIVWSQLIGGELSHPASPRIGKAPLYLRQSNGWSGVNYPALKGEACGG